MKITHAEPLSEQASQAGFIAGAIFLLTILIGESVLREGIVTTHLLMGLTVLVCIGIVAALRTYKPQPKRRPVFYRALFTAVSAVMAWLILTAMKGVSLSIAESSWFVLALLLSMISAFRAPAGWYAGLALAVSILMFLSTRYLTASILTFIAVIGIFVVINYGVQLVLDHSRETRLVLAKDGPEVKVAGKSALRLLVPVLILVAIGLILNYWIQRSILHAAYAEPKVGDLRPALIHPACRNGPVDAEQLERDLDCSISKREELLLTLADDQIDTASANITALAQRGPAELAKQLKDLKPPTIDTYSSCDGFQIDLKFDSVTFRSPCRTLIDHINETLTRTHSRIVGRITSAADTAGNDVVAEVAGGKEELRGAAKEEIKAGIERLRRTNHYVFVALYAYGWLSWLLLIVAVVAAYQMMLGRVVFDPKTPRSVSFRLARSAIKPISSTRVPVLRLNEDLPKKTFRENNTTRWFVKLSVSRRGRGTGMNACIPFKQIAVIRRLFTGSYLMTCIDAEPKPIENGPELSISGDHRLVRIRVEPGQRVGFHMSDLVAFTDRITLRSRYSTHVGASLLQLGSFYVVAEGDQPKPSEEGQGDGGYLVLKSEGEHVFTSAQGGSTPATALLAWDEAAEFSLDQRLHPIGIWVNEPSLFTQSVRGSVLLDEGTPSRWPIMTRLGGLLRYLLLPV